MSQEKSKTIPMHFFSLGGGEGVLLGFEKVENEH